DADLLEWLFRREKFDHVIHFAAESHVDRSIDGPQAFIDTNVNGTCALLEASRTAWERGGRNEKFRFLHVSTDEVYGSLGPTGAFTEETPYDPSSPYSASKAASDHFVKAYHRTYGLPVLVTNCSNNFGPYQFPEKLIPLMILNIVEQDILPVYGDGKNVRDWLYVVDHCEALCRVLGEGRPGESYNIGGGTEMSNIDIVTLICDMVDDRLGRPKGTGRKLIRFVEDRLGHDRRYAIDPTKMTNELNWTAGTRFSWALKETVEWYLSNMDWVKAIKSGQYRKWSDSRYSGRCFKPERRRVPRKTGVEVLSHEEQDEGGSDRFWDELSKRRL
ncbi:MAG: dTDP-glucose 4,6-dehydratase, partial [Pseudomonadales bacterium]|nr:dTDP-glucose 4,6-dehydratase [Pseudomonadales bacterium]